MTESENESTPDTEKDAVADDGFPAEDVMPDDPDPDLDVNDPFGVGEGREPLEEGEAPEGAAEPEDPAR